MRHARSEIGKPCTFGCSVAERVAFYVYLHGKRIGEALVEVQATCKLDIKNIMHSQAALVLHHACIGRILYVASDTEIIVPSKSGNHLLRSLRRSPSRMLAQAL